jgi:uncharacterized protein (DUF924 family)
MSEPTEIDDVHAYWLGAEPATQAELDARGTKWFRGGAAVDDEIRAKFGDLVERARAGKLDAWHATAKGSIAWLILVDQFSRNLYRDDPRAFSSDPQALNWARDGFETGKFDHLSTPEKMFAILPFEHAEDLDAQRRACALVTQIALAATPLYQGILKTWFEFARKHLDVIARFGRFPHRNAVLGRESTPDELAYLAYCKLIGTWL